MLELGCGSFGVVSGLPVSAGSLDTTLDELPVYSKRSRRFIPARNFGCKQPSPGNLLHYMESIEICSVSSGILGSNIVI